MIMRKLPLRIQKKIQEKKAKALFHLAFHGASDIGLSRGNNEDVFSMLENQRFFVLADGMGGHKAGEIAAKEAVKASCVFIKNFFQTQTSSVSAEEIFSIAKAGIQAANRWVYYLGKEKRSCRGMGTTLCTLLFHKQVLIYSHVGDSRIYRFRKKELEQLTVDHSLKNVLISQGKMSPLSSKTFPYKNVLTKAIGTHPEVEPDIEVTKVNQDDVYLMCTDGLTDYVSNQTIHCVLKEEKNLQSASKLLIHLAKENGGNDNITIVLVRVDGNKDSHLSRSQRYHSS